MLTQGHECTCINQHAHMDTTLAHEHIILSHKKYFILRFIFKLAKTHLTSLLLTSKPRSFTTVILKDDLPLSPAATILIVFSLESLLYLSFQTASKLLIVDIVMAVSFNFLPIWDCSHALTDFCLLFLFGSPHAWKLLHTKKG